ncbi:acetylcholinesterase [Trichoderma sp. SZMC 28014]
MLRFRYLTFLALATRVITGGSTSLPKVDLGYGIYQASSFNATGENYNFSNIRYAQPPLGNLRFAAPVPPTGRNKTVNDGTYGFTCPQANPAWTSIAESFAGYVAAGNESTFNYTLANAELEAQLRANGNYVTLNPSESEDCLFLDVIVPKAIFDRANSRHRKSASGGAPVLVWIYGGGYTIGSKSGSGDPGGLIRASQADGSSGIIFVAMNYRLGAIGWLAGPTLQAAGGVSNAGLYDQRLAIEWVASNIHLFGGDPNQITLIGESAGGGSVEHQITAYGGLKNVSFQRAIPQSPGFQTIPSTFYQENTTQTFLKYLNVSTIKEARNASTTAVRTANALMILHSPYSVFKSGPVVDGTFVPALPGQLLVTGSYAKNLTIMTGHNADEGALFTPPYIKTDDDLTNFLRSFWPGISDTAIQIVLDYYPAVYNGTYGYTSPIDRSIFFFSEVVFTCNTHYMLKAFPNSSYAYEFEVSPALHGMDVQYTFYNGQGTNLLLGLIAPVAEIMQGYITNFAKTGNPNGAGLPFFPKQGNNATEEGLNATLISIERDPTDNARCEFWQKALYY